MMDISPDLRRLILQHSEMRSRGRVLLTEEEIVAATAIGTLRHEEAVRQGLPDLHGLDPADGLAKHIMGALGECAYCKYKGVRWDMDVNTFHSKPDVGNCEIRTRGQAHYELIVRTDDADDREYVLVYDNQDDPSEFFVRGSILGHEAKRSEWWKSHGDREAAWFVPIKALRAVAPAPEPQQP